MSLFAALVPPPDAVRDLAGELAGELARHRRPAAHGVRWTSEASWHLTLAFYGNDPAHGDDGARGRAGWLAPRLTGRAPVRLGLAGAGSFPGVLWAGVGGDLVELHALGLAAGAGDPSAGPDGGRPLHPHLTLARWRAPRRPDAVRQVVLGMTGYRGPSWLATEVVLFSSERRPGGPPRYVVLERFGLRG